MEPIITTLNLKKILLNKIIFEGSEFTEINITRLVIRPVMKRIVFFTEEIEKIIIYEGDIEFDAHKDDSQETLIDALLSKIDLLYKA